MNNNKGELPFSSIIGAECTIHGDLIISSSARVDGYVEGNITVEGSLILGESGIIKGNVVAKNFISGGKHYGNLYIRDKVELTQTSEQMGDVYSKTILIDEEAVFQGKCNTKLTEEEINSAIKKADE